MRLLTKPDPGKVFRNLKDFQRTTVEYVFERLYGNNDPVNRFLVADEVGLGKTLIARGVIAKVIDHHWQERDRRIDIVYICANRDIAAQNIARLNVTDQKNIALASRLTLLPLRLNQLDDRLNFVSFTPGTSFDLRSRGGVVKERALLYCILRTHWALGDGAAPKLIFRGDVGLNAWKRQIEVTEEEYGALNKELVDSFIAALKKTDIKRRFDALLEQLAHSRTVFPPGLRQERTALVGDLRRVLAQSCLRALEPDLIILDEFQRFKNLLEAEDEIAELAHDLFSYRGAKVLLLSATPYKMYTMTHEREQDDHYEDFIRTVRFLMEDTAAEGFERDLDEYRLALYDIGENGRERLLSAKSAVEQKLRRVMVRTERLAVTADRDGMVANAAIESCRLAPQDLKGFAFIDGIARALDVPDAVEYWRAAPYLINFMDQQYALKRLFRAKLESRELPDAVVTALETHRGCLLPWNAINRYRRIDPCNAKLRALLDSTVGQGAWQLLWVPPSLPYYTVSSGPYSGEGLRDFTKTLVFSSWQVVPKMIATLCSYDAERSIVKASKGRFNYGELTKRRRPLIKFSLSEGRLAGMNFFQLMYPCMTLAAQIDPLAIARELAKGGRLSSLEKLREEVEGRILSLMTPVFKELGAVWPPPKGSSLQDYDQHWYAAALVLLDRQYHREVVEEWRSAGAAGESELEWTSLVPGHKEDEESRFADHVKHLWEFFDLKARLGTPPPDLIEVLTKNAIGAPATVGLRSLLRLAAPIGGGTGGDVMMGAAASIAFGLRSLFNLPESILIIQSQREEGDERYWEGVLDYCRNGHLQAVMDEYVHVLRESLGLQEAPLDTVVKGIAMEIASAVSLRTVTLEVDEISVGEKRVSRQEQRLRCRFALRYGDAKNEDDGEETREDQVRKAFNSPFRPFILASTSVGQEGLDFHHYCHNIYHWNLPSNPVDLEQREGRVHRYKGHVIRRNVARQIPLAFLLERLQHLDDPWEHLFTIAKERRSSEHNDLVPYWICETDKGFKINRYIPALPFSREVEHFERLKETLAAYRMVFGQPRQEDLIAHLRLLLERDLSLEELLMYRIDLEPKCG